MKLLNQSSLTKNIRNIWSWNPTTAQSSTTCISQCVESQSPWIIDSSAFDHISGNTSLLSSLSFTKTTHCVWLISSLLYYCGTGTFGSCVASSSRKLRLGYPHFSKLKKMVPETSSFRMWTMSTGKHIRYSFPKHHESICNYAFLSSILIFGSQVSSFGFRYFVTFIFEFSRCTWIYLMKDLLNFCLVLGLSLIK